MSLKHWNGTAFVDASAYRIWNGSAFVAPQGIYAWNGTAFVKHWPLGMPVYDNSTVLEGSATTNFNMTVASGAAVIVFVAGNITNAARVDGVAMTLVGKTSNAAMYYATGLAAGSRNIQVDRNGSSSHIVSAASYTGVTAVSGGATGSGTSATPTGTPSGSGSFAVAGFDFGASTSDVPLITSNGSIRQIYRRTAGNVLGLADRAGSPVQLTTPVSGAWTSIAVWLS